MCRGGERGQARASSCLIRGGPSGSLFRLLQAAVPLCSGLAASPQLRGWDWGPAPCPLRTRHLAACPFPRPASLRLSGFESQPPALPRTSRPPAQLSPPLQFITGGRRISCVERASREPPRLEKGIHPPGPAPGAGRCPREASPPSCAGQGARAGSQRQACGKGLAHPGWLLRHGACAPPLGSARVGDPGPGGRGRHEERLGVAPREGGFKENQSH